MATEWSHRLTATQAGSVGGWLPRQVVREVENVGLPATLYECLRVVQYAKRAAARLYATAGLEPWTSHPACR